MKSIFSEDVISYEVVDRVETFDDFRIGDIELISNSATIITVDSTGLFPTSGSLTIGSEIITYTDKSGTQFTGCTRGTSGYPGRSVSTARAYEKQSAR